MRPHDAGFHPTTTKERNIAEGPRCADRRHRPPSITSSARASLPQRLPARSTGPPRFPTVPGRTASRATARPTGRARSTTPGLATQPTGYSTYWQYTTAPAFSVLAVMNPVTSSAANAIESFIFGVLQDILIASSHFGGMSRLDVRLRVFLIWINVPGPDQTSAPGSDSDELRLVAHLLYRSAPRQDRRRRHDRAAKAVTRFMCFFLSR
jgi:hypothetical protein